MLMGSHLSKFLVIKGFVFGAVLYHAPGGFNHVIPKVAVAGFVHGRIFRLELSGLVLFPDDAAVFGKCIIALKALDGAKLSKDAAGVDRANTGHGGQVRIWYSVGLRPFTALWMAPLMALSSFSKALMQLKEQPMETVSGS